MNSYGLWPSEQRPALSCSLLHHRAAFALHMLAYMTMARVAAPSRLFGQRPFSLRRQGRSARPLHVQHASPQEGEGGGEESLEKLVKEMILQDPETAERLQRVGDAARRVAELQVTSATLLPFGLPSSWRSAQTANFHS